MTCPSCGVLIDSKREYSRRVYKKYDEKDRFLIGEAIRKGGDWRAVAELIGINRKTAEAWASAEDHLPKPRGGNRRRIINENNRETLISWLESDPQLTVKQMKERAETEMDLQVCEATISRVLNGQGFTIKKMHYEPQNMNTPENKLKRKVYVENLQRFNEMGRS